MWQPKPKSTSGKWHRVDAFGLQKTQVAHYRGFRYEIRERTVGTTLRRRRYCVSIAAEVGPKTAFLAELPSAPAARAAARRWIDRTLDPITETMDRQWARIAQRASRIHSQRRYWAERGEGQQ